MATILTFGSLTLSSSEIINFSWKRSFNINQVSTVALIEITQPGNLTPIELSIKARITANASSKFTLFTNLLSAKTLEPLNFLNRNLGSFYFADLSIDSDELDDLKDVLRMDCDLLFISNQNFS